MDARRRLLTTVALTLAAALPAGTACGSTLSVDENHVITFQAAPGEANVISFSSPQYDAYELSDTGSAIAVGDGCESTQSGTVRCPGYRLEVRAGDQDDSVSRRGDSGPTSETLYGEEGNDTLLGSAIGGPGNDRLTTLERFDEVDGGDGDDVIENFAGVQVAAGAGNDRVVNYPACDSCGSPAVVEGGEGDDELIGSPYPDSLSGGPSADVIRSEGTAATLGEYDAVDTLSGGEGDDLLVVGGGKRIAPPPFGTPTGLSGTGMAVGNVDGGPGDDRLEGSPNRDVLSGSDGNDYISGGDGWDTLVGGDGKDSLHGGDGSDGLYGGAGADLIDGGAGESDGVTYEDEALPVSIDLTRPGGDGPRGENDTILPGVDQFFLTRGNDRFVAGRLPVDVYGGFGRDVLIGSPRDDRMRGDGGSGPTPPDSNFGADRLEGRGGEDELYGDPGSDTIRGGSGNDFLDGGVPISFYQGTTTRHPSDDVISGGPGNDGVRHGWRVDAGPGDDSIDLADFHRDNRSPVIPLGRDGNARCGAGSDFVRGDYYDGTGLDCEILSEGAVSFRSLRPDAKGGVSLTVRCAWDFNSPCRGSARLARTPAQTVETPDRTLIRTTLPASPRGCRRSAQTRVLTAHSFRIRAGRVNRVTLRLGRRARRLLARAGCLVIRADFRLRDPKRRSYEMTRTFALRPPR
jgi:Ca2+-binding RTX toxin-like protein